jgi:3-dehydroquinate synthase
MEPVRIDVTTPSRRYVITLADGVLDRLARILDDAKLPARRFVVSSPLVWRFHGQRFARAVSAESIIVPDGERFKQLATVSQVRRTDSRERRSRVDLITFGGGVIGDRLIRGRHVPAGIALVHVPTTLLAQVDSAIGGKVGVNHALGKNLIGAFYQPEVVVIDPSVLGTLPLREFRAGLYEVIKYGMTSSPTLFDRVGKDRKAIFARQPDTLAAVIGESCRIKADVVAADEKESGVRRILNFGHTAGHAIEAVTKYRRYRHGEAVAYGMLVAAELAVARGALADRDRKALADVIASPGRCRPSRTFRSVRSWSDAARQENDRRTAARRAPHGDWRDDDRRRCDGKEMKKALERVGFRKSGSPSTSLQRLEAHLKNFSRQPGIARCFLQRLNDFPPLDIRETRRDASAIDPERSMADHGSASSDDATMSLFIVRLRCRA